MKKDINLIGQNENDPHFESRTSASCKSKIEKESYLKRHEEINAALDREYGGPQSSYRNLRFLR